MRFRGRDLFVLLTLATAACTGSPVSPAGPVTVTAAGPVAPANGAQITFGSQPVTLTVTNATVSNASAGVTYTFEVASDAAFANKVQTKDTPEGSGQTSVTLAPLAAGSDYYWHVRTVAGGTTGAFTNPLKFTIGPAIAISAPVQIAPVNGTTSALLRPTLVVTNAVSTGPVGRLFYRFDISQTDTFAAVVVTGTVPEGNGQTSFSVPTDLTISASYFWRVQAVDTDNNVTGAFSGPAKFTTALTIDLTKVVYLKGPNISNWPQTGTLNVVEQNGADGSMCMQFTDPGWPGVPWPYLLPGEDPNFTIFANQWYFANIGGTWYGGAGEWLYRGAAACKGGQGTHSIGPDSGFGPPFSNWVPKVGELVGYAVTTPARNYPQTRSVDERTNVILVPWKDTSLGSLTVSSIKR
jgi:hypothetical protein